MVVAKRAEVTVAARSTEEFRLNVFCVNMTRRAPAREDTFDLGAKADEPLDKVLRVIENNRLVEDNGGQEAVWAVTDNAAESDILKQKWGAAAALLDPHSMAADAKTAQKVLDEAGVNRRFDDPNLDADNYYEA